MTAVKKHTLGKQTLTQVAPSLFWYYASQLLDDRWRYKETPYKKYALD